MPKRTFQPNRRRRAKVHGFLVRMASKAGAAVLSRRRRGHDCPGRFGGSGQVLVAVLRSSGIEGPGPDRHLSPEIETAVELVRSGAVLTSVEEVIGDLK